MSWTAPKDTSLPNIVIHGVDAAADAGDSTKGYHSTLNVFGIYPMYEPNFEPVECINNNLIYSKYFVERYEIEFAPFKVRLNSNWQDYKDLDYFLKYVVKKDYLFSNKIIDISKSDQLDSKEQYLFISNFYNHKMQKI